MASSARSSSRLRFGNFEVDLHSCEVWEHGNQVRLQDQPFQVLRVLLERRGKIVTREELRQTLWPADTFVDFDDGLNTAVKKIRGVLGDSADQPRYIETIPRRGYRFVGNIEGQSTEETAATATASDSRLAETLKWRRAARPAVYAAVGVLVLLVVLLAADVRGWRSRLLGPAATPRIESLAVMPLTNLSHDPEQEYFADGMTEALIANLAQVRALRVISRTSMMHYKGTDKTIRQIARELNVDAVIEGAVQRSGNRVRVTAQLIQGQTDVHLWAKTYDRDSQDVLMMESELAQAIAGEIKVQLTPLERQQLASARPINPDAYNAYLLGNFHSTKRTPAAIAKGIDYFQQAIRTDPNYTEAYAGLANAYFENEVWGGLGFGKMADQIRANTLKALELDENLAEAHELLGRIHYQYDWDWQRTETELKRAMELNANLASSYEQYAFYLQTMGRHEEAITTVHQAVKLDPLSPWYICEEGRILFRARQYEKAIERYQRALELDPRYVPALGRMSDAYGQLGKYEDALAYVQRMQQVLGEKNTSPRWRAEIYARMGRTREATEILRNAEKNGTLDGDKLGLAVIYSALGERDRAIAVLERGAEMHAMMPFVLVDPRLDPLRSGPRFQQLLRRVGLAP